MEVTTDLMDHIKKSLEGISFGKVIVSIDSGSDVVTADVTVENRTRYKLKKREDAGTIVKPVQR